MSKNPQDQGKSSAKPQNEPLSLTGSFLVATPALRDPRFLKSVIYICAHDAEHAMGIAVDHILTELSLSDLLADFPDFDPEETLPNHPIVQGGPVETERGFVLHTPDYFEDDSSLTLSENLVLTTSKGVLEAMRTDFGPRQAVIALGYAGWSAGQLEQELADNFWMVVPANEAMVFTPSKTKWKDALAILGIKPEHLTAESGRA